MKTYSIPAAVLNSFTSDALCSQVYRDLYSVRKGREPGIKLLYLTPERLVNSASMQDLLDCLQEHVSGKGALPSLVPACLCGLPAVIWCVCVCVCACVCASSACWRGT
jgi:hypothetical protein